MMKMIQVTHLGREKKKSENYKKWQTDGYIKHSRLLKMSVAQGCRLSYKLNIGRSFIQHVGKKGLLFSKQEKEVLGKSWIYYPYGMQCFLM